MIVELGNASIETKGFIQGTVMFDAPGKPFPQYRNGSF
jgi:hypothetical protein